MKGAIYIARTTSGRGSAVARAAWNTRTTDSLALDSILSVVAHRRTLLNTRTPFLFLFRPFALQTHLLAARGSFTLPPSFSSFLLTSISSYLRVLFTLFKSIRGFLWFTIPIHHRFLSRFPSFHGTVASETVNYASDIIVVFCRPLAVVSFPPVFFLPSSTLKNITRCAFSSWETPNVSFRRNVRDPWRMVSTLSYRVVVFFTRLFLFVHRRVTWCLPFGTHYSHVWYYTPWPIHLVHLIIAI